MDSRVDFVIELYELFYRDFTGNSRYKFNYNKQNLSLVNKFVESLDHRYGDDWLFEYFGFQFQIRSTQETKIDFMFGKVKIMLSWIIGPKALNNYLKSSDGQKFYGRDYIRKKGIKNPRKVDQYLSFENSEMKDYFNRERRRFINTDLGLVHCKDLKLSYDIKSKYCLICKHKKICTGLVIE